MRLLRGKPPVFGELLQGSLATATFLSGALGALLLIDAHNSSGMVSIISCFALRLMQSWHAKIRFVLSAPPDEKPGLPQA